LKPTSDRLKSPLNQSNLPILIFAPGAPISSLSPASVIRNMAVFFPSSALNVAHLMPWFPIPPTGFTGSLSEGYAMKLKELTNNTFKMIDHTMCPQCFGKLATPKMELVSDKGYQLVYKCLKCPRSYMVTPVTTFEFIELQ
jgi:hypothetical protein